MNLLRRTAPLFLVALLSFIFGGIILLTVTRVGQEKPIAPTAPESRPQAVDGSPVPECQVNFTVTVASPSPTPSVTPTPSPTPRVTPTPSPTPSPTPRVTPTPTPTPRVTPTPSPTPRVTPTPSPTPRVTPTPSPVPSPTPAPICIDLRVYRIIAGEWRLVDFTGQDPTNPPPRPGETIYFAVLGGSTIGDYTQARFRIYNNGILLPGDNNNPDGWRYTTDRNANGEFYIPYTLSLSATTNFSVGAEVFFPGFGWL